jgi:hypothetical protein
MSQTPCKRCGFPLPIRWPRAGGDLSRPNSIHQCADRALIRSEHPPNGVLHSPNGACKSARRRRRAGIPSIIGIGANIKSP